MNFTLTESTIDVLKNFARINSQITLKKGTDQRTFHPSRSFIADVVLDSPIPVECVIYNLNQLLGVIDIGKTDKYPDIQFGETSLVVKGGISSITIPYADPVAVTPTPTHKFVMEEQYAKFGFNNHLWTKISKTSAILKASTLEFEITNGKLQLNLIDEKARGMARASFDFSTAVVSPSAPNGSWVVSFDTLELMTGDYEVEIGIMNSPQIKNKLFGAFFKLQNSHTISYITSGLPVSK